MANKGQPRRAIDMVWIESLEVVSQNPSNSEATDYNAEIMVDLQGNPTIAKAWISFFHLDNQVDKFLIWAFPAGLLFVFIGI